MAHTTNKNGTRVAPTETTEDFYGQKRVRLEHDAFGVIKLFRTQVGGAGCTLFGSDLRHQQVVSIEIHRADETRVHNTDRITSEECIVRFQMSEAQWAQHVSSIGCGTGVPLTLERAPARGTPIMPMPDIQARAKRDLHEAEFLEMGRRASKGVCDVQNRLSEFLKPGAKSPSKKDLEALLSELRHAGEQFEGNMDYANKSFQEEIENTVQAAKTEIETFAGNLAMRVGFDALTHGATAPTMLENDKTPLLEGEAT